MPDNLSFDIAVLGVGGQGIGLLSETLLRAADHAGLPVRSVDTHGLAQRGGLVISHVRLGKRAHSALIGEGQADMVVALERHEALRGLNTYLVDDGILVYYDAVWQPLRVRLRRDQAVTAETIADECARRDVRLVRVFVPNLPDPRMQNVALLAELSRLRLVPGVEPAHVEAALTDLLDGDMLEANLKLFRALTASSTAGSM